jgi:hypothetical protein
MAKRLRLYTKFRTARLATGFSQAFTHTVPGVWLAETDYCSGIPLHRSSFIGRGLRNSPTDRNYESTCPLALLAITIGE